jgi:hypothetical protein
VPDASEVRTRPTPAPGGIEKPVIFAVPTTSSFAEGVVVPMPTLPAGVTLKKTLSGYSKPMPGSVLAAKQLPVATSRRRVGHCTLSGAGAPPPVPAPTASTA